MIDIKALDVDSCWSDASEVLKDAIDLSNGRHTIETTYEASNLPKQKNIRNYILWW